MNRSIGWLVGVGSAGAVGLVSGLTMPRGPVSTAQVVWVLLTSIGLGVVAGYSTRSRWAMLAAPTAYAALFELARAGADGPSVDGIHLGTPIGILAFLSGRGFHGLVGLLPIVVGAAYGAALARRTVSGPVHPHGASRVALYARRAVVGILAAFVLVLGVLAVRPARTASIVGSDGKPLPGSVAELDTVTVGGHDQSIMIRGHSDELPVLLYLAGGPGGTDLGAMRIFSESLERDFVVATWDQRGAGKSYPALDPASTLTLDRSVADAIEVTNYLRQRFDESRIYLVGNSWGTTLGVLAVQQHPELYHAFVGTGQMVSQSETDRMFYEDTVAWAQGSGQHALADRLIDLGPPPYDDPWNYAAMLSYERQWNVYERDPTYDAKGEMPLNVFVGEYNLVEQLHAFNAFLDTAAVLYPQLQEIDFRRDVPQLEVPVYLVQGRHEARGRAVLATAWFDQLQAPSKQLIVFEASGHRPLFEEPDRFHDVMTGLVLAETYPGR